MHIKINKSDFLDILAKVQGLTGRKSNLAITENVLIKTKDEYIQLLVTDLESGFEGFYAATIESEGAVVINSRKFYEIVREFPSEEIWIQEIENHWIKIGNQKVQYHIVGMNPEDFPEIPSMDSLSLFEIDQGAFSKMIEKTVIISGSSDDKRPQINGVFFEVIEGDRILRMVSTDGSRLCLVDYASDKGFSGLMEKGLIIPKKGLSEVAKFLDGEGTVKIGVKENKFIVKKGRETIVIRLLEGAFPKYQDIIVKGNGHLITLDRKIFFSMLRRMSILSSETYKSVLFTFDENILIISATNPDIGESKEEMSIDFGGDKTEMAFNPKFFIDTLNVIEDEAVILFVSSADKPCLIEGKENKNFISVIMPMKV